ncbi:MAG: hypothetical protein P8Z36_15595 [Gemmatimonadota bacterium]|jgi:hypothetical protein
MKKLFVALVIVVAALSAFPSLRARAAPQLAPLWHDVRRLLKKPLRPFVTPVQKQHANSEVLEIMRALKESVFRDARVPRTGDFTRWVNARNLTDHNGLDPWGKPYTLLQSRDTLYVVSPGPDTTLNTADDIKAGFPHRR